MRQIINRFIPFLLFGIAVVAFAFGIILLAYLFFFGALIGLTLFLAAWIRARFFPSRLPKKASSTRKGRVIDSDDWNQL